MTVIIFATSPYYFLVRCNSRTDISDEKFPYGRPWFRIPPPWGRRIEFCVPWRQACWPVSGEGLRRFWGGCGILAQATPIWKSFNLSGRGHRLEYFYKVYFVHRRRTRRDPRWHARSGLKLRGELQYLNSCLISWLSGGSSKESDVPNVVPSWLLQAIW